MTFDGQPGGAVGLVLSDIRTQRPAGWRQQDNEFSTMSEIDDTIEAAEQKLIDLTDADQTLVQERNVTVGIKLYLTSGATQRRTDDVMGFELDAIAVLEDCTRLDYSARRSDLLDQGEDDD